MGTDVHKKRHMLVSDMDGTLLNSRVLVSPENQAAILRFVEAGGVFCIATGRAVGSVLRFAGPLAARYGICLNGAVIYDFQSDAIVSKTPMPDACRRFAEEVVAGAEEVCLIVYTERGMHMLRNHEIMAEHGVREEYSGLLTPSRLVPETWYKMILSGPQEVIDTLKARVDGAYPELSALRSGRRFCEITGMGVSKGAGLETVCRLSGVALRDTAAVGDNENDLPMLRIAGLSMAVGNARASVAREADHLLPHRDESPLVRGVALAMERFGMAR